MGLEEIIKKKLLILVKDLTNKHIELGMRATGRWIDSLEVEVNGNKGIVKGEDYTKYLSIGRPPNRNSDETVIRKWAVGMALNNPDFKAWLKVRGLEKYGVPIAYKIGRQGTKWYKQGGSDLLDGVLTDDYVLEMETEIGVEIAYKIAEDLRRQIITA